MPKSETLYQELDKSLNDFITELTDPKEGANVGTIPAIVAGVTNKDRTFSLNAQGLKNIDRQEPISLDTQLSIFSCTKSITAFAILKLFEDQKINLDIPAKTYLPLIGELHVVEKNSVDEKGNLIFPPRKPDNQVSVRHLLLHTSGLAYNFNNEVYAKLAQTNFKIIDNENEEYFSSKTTPLTFEPGSKWQYGHSFDILGFIVQSITGKRFGEYLKEVLFDPAGMTSTTFHLKDESNLATIHAIHTDGSYKSAPKLLSSDPNLEMGGQGLFSTAGDYLKFLRVWLNYGYSPDGDKQLLKAKTVRYAIQDHLPPGVSITMQNGTLAPPDDGFTLTGNGYSTNGIARGRPAGSIYWGGLANLKYWIDFENQIAGFWACQIVPPSAQIANNFISFEQKVYQALFQAEEFENLKI